MYFLLFVRHSKDFVGGIIKIWSGLCSAAAGGGGSAIEPSTSGGNTSAGHWNCELVSLLSLLFLVDCDALFTKHCNATADDSSDKTTILGFWLHLLSTRDIQLRYKMSTLKLLPFFCAMNKDVQDKVLDALELFKVHHIPLR